MTAIGNAPKNPDLRAEHIQKTALDKYARDFAVVYNKAWAGHGGLKSIDEKVVKKNVSVHETCYG